MPNGVDNSILINAVIKNKTSALRYSNTYVCKKELILIARLVRNQSL